MKLIDLCEPIFHYVCRVNRASRLGRACPFVTTQIRNDVEALLEKTAERAKAEKLGAEFARVRLPILFFLDHVIVNHPARNGQEWRRLALSELPPADRGDERFFRLLDEALDDPSEEAAEYLEVFYHCITLGMEGTYKGKPGEIAGLLAKVARRLPGWREEEEPRVCTEAYKHTIRGGPVQSVRAPLTLIWVAMAGMLVAVVIVSGLIYRTQTRTLDRLVSPFQPAVEVGGQN